MEERLLPGGSTQRATRPGRGGLCGSKMDGHAPVLASLVFVLLAVVRSAAVVRTEYGMGMSVRHPHSTIQVAAPVLRFLITAPLLAVANFVERRAIAAASLAALNQRITSREPVFVPPGPCAVPWVGIFFLALVDTNATVGLSVATRASAAADAAFSAFSTGCITVPITIGLSRLVLGRTFRRSQLAAAALSAGGIALGGAMRTVDWLPRRVRFSRTCWCVQSFHSCITWRSVLTSPGSTASAAQRQLRPQSALPWAWSACRWPLRLSTGRHC